MTEHAPPVLTSAQSYSLRAVIVDDELLARQRLRRLLSAVPGVKVVGEFTGAGHAREGLSTLRPDLLFLDVSMPGEDGFGLLASIPDELRPYVVFVTAHPDAAVKAFDARASDFLVKPIRPERLEEAVARARGALGRPEHVETGFSDSEGKEKPFTPVGRSSVSRLEQDIPEFLAATVGKRTRYLRLSDVECFRAEGNYIRVYIGGEQHLVRLSMTRLERMLDPRRFARIHRSSIVRVDCIHELLASGQGDYVVVMKSGERLDVMRTYRHRLPR